MNELKPCPFCGGEAQILSYRTTNDERWVTKYYAECTDCHIDLPASLASEEKQEAIEVWNRRAVNRCKTCKYMTDNAKDANYRNGYCSRREAGNWYKISGDDYCSFWEGMDNADSD